MASRKLPDYDNARYGIPDRLPVIHLPAISGKIYPWMFYLIQMLNFHDDMPVCRYDLPCSRLREARE